MGLEFGPLVTLSGHRVPDALGRDDPPGVVAYVQTRLS